jgi:hypothetical protein
MNAFQGGKTMRDGRNWMIAAGAALLLGAGPAMAAADGLPLLDPTSGVSGTMYDIVMPGAGISMDPAALDLALSWGGTVRVYQGVGNPALDAYVNLDTDRDGLTDRTMTCEGIVGGGRFALHCADDDGLGQLDLLVRGKAVTLSDGRLSLRKATGRGFTDSQVFNVGFQANQQLP